MVLAPAWQTVPFHWIWISLAMLSGFRLWSLPQAVVVTAAVAVVSGAAMFAPGGMAVESVVELTEVPLMAAVFAAMVWHARRRQEALDEVRRVSECERDFVRDAAHELRTPITVARGHVELVRDALAPDTRARADTEIVLDELRRLSRMSDRLLLLAVADHAGFVRGAPVDVGVVLHDVARRWRIASGCTPAVHIEARISVLADEERLRTALDALIENALHASGRNGRVTLVAREFAGAAVLEVGDDGPGVAPEHQDRIFDRFARAADRRTGTGLGLPIVKAIIEAHGGRVTLHSTPGAGATFALHLPLAPRAALARPRVAAVAAAAAG